ncbi:hypothetical protein F4802DRAFT_529319 [Xylaria palmicola]|nr:hypothetical protein F4802DRAFT_529319 [Xylaria palmicola]
MTRGCAMTLLFSKRSTCSPVLLTARLSATYACPFSNTLPRSTLTLSNVWPCALWMDSAHARIRGSCLRAACTSPVGSSTFQSSWIQRIVRCVPSVAVNRTTGYSRKSFLLSESRLNAFILLFALSSPPLSSSNALPYSPSTQTSNAASAINPSTLPSDPLTSVSSIFLISITWAPFFRSKDLGAIILASSLSRTF